MFVVVRQTNSQKYSAWISWVARCMKPHGSDKNHTVPWIYHTISVIKMNLPLKQYNHKNYIWCKRDSSIGTPINISISAIPVRYVRGFFFDSSNDFTAFADSKKSYISLFATYPDRLSPKKNTNTLSFSIFNTFAGHGTEYFCFANTIEFKLKPFIFTNCEGTEIFVCCSLFFQSQLLILDDLSSNYNWCAGLFQIWHAFSVAKYLTAVKCSLYLSRPCCVQKNCVWNFYLVFRFFLVSQMILSELYVLIGFLLKLFYFCPLFAVYLLTLFPTASNF